MPNTFQTHRDPYSKKPLVIEIKSLQREYQMKNNTIISRYVD